MKKYFPKLVFPVILRGQGEKMSLFVENVQDAKSNDDFAQFRRLNWCAIGYRPIYTVALL